MMKHTKLSAMSWITNDRDEYLVYEQRGRDIVSKWNKDKPTTPNFLIQWRRESTTEIQVIDESSSLWVDSFEFILFLRNTGADVQQHQVVLNQKRLGAPIATNLRGNRMNPVVLFTIKDSRLRSKLEKVLRTSTHRQRHGPH